MTTQGTLINTLAPHIRPDIDAIDAIDKLQRFGESVIPGVSRARIDFWGSVPGCFPPDMSAAEFESKGIIRVDDGFGRFDEHLPDGGRKIDEQGNEECSASLVAKALGCSNHPVAAQVMKMARQCDTKGDLLSFGLSKMVKTIGKAFKDDHRTFAWAKTALNAVYSQGSSVFRMDDAEKMAAGKRWANFVAVWRMSRFAEKDFPEMATGAANYLTCGVPDEFFFRLGERPYAQPI